MVALRGSTVVLRSAVAADGDELATIRATDEVRRWWGDADRAAIEADLADRGATRLVIELDGAVVGLIQYAAEQDPEYRHASIDISVDPAMHQRGLASDAIRTLVGHLFTAERHHRITIDPDVDNTAAIGCYRSVGFREVGVMRSYQVLPDGTYADGLLMELVKSI